MAEDRVRCASALLSGPKPTSGGEEREGGGPHLHSLLHPRMDTLGPLIRCPALALDAQPASREAPAWPGHVQAAQDQPEPPQALGPPGATSSPFLRRPHHTRAQVRNLTSGHPERPDSKSLSLSPNPRYPVMLVTKCAWSSPWDTLWFVHEGVFCFWSIEELWKGDIYSRALLAYGLVGFKACCWVKLKEIQELRRVNFLGKTSFVISVHKYFSHLPWIFQDILLQVFSLTGLRIHELINL